MKNEGKQFSISGTVANRNQSGITFHPTVFLPIVLSFVGDLLSVPMLGI